MQRYRFPYIRSGVATAILLLFLRAANSAVVPGLVEAQGRNLPGEAVVTFSPPMSIQPESRTVHRGEIVVLRVGESGVAPFSYQWFSNGTAVVNQTNATLLAPTFSRDDSASYRVAVTDSTGNAITSRDATVTVIDPRAASVTLRPALDTSIHSSGTNPRGTATILSGTRRNGARDRGLLRFDLSPIPTNAILDGASVSLRLFRDPGSPVESTFYLHRLLKPWGAEASWTNASGTVPWSAPGGEGGGDYLTDGIPAVFLSGSDDFVFSSTNQLLADLSEWAQNPATNHGWILISDGEATTSTARHFDSSESANPPQLVISYSVSVEIPSMKDVRQESTNFVFEIPGAAGWFYNVQGRVEADRGAWTPFTNAPAGAGLAPIVITIPMTNSHEFFRALRY